jgi:hypothetical protein
MREEIPSYVKPYSIPNDIKIENVSRETSLAIKQSEFFAAPIERPGSGAAESLLALRQSAGVIRRWPSANSAPDKNRVPAGTGNSNWRIPMYRFEGLCDIIRLLHCNPQAELPAHLE